MSLLFNMLSRLVITFLPRSKRLLISWLQSPSAVILEPRKIKSDTVSTFSPSTSHEVVGPDAVIFVFWLLSFKPTFSLSTFTFIKRLLSSSSLFCHKGGVIWISEVTDISPGNLDSSLCFFQSSVSHYVFCKKIANPLKSCWYCKFFLLQIEHFLENQIQQQPGISKICYLKYIV